MSFEKDFERLQKLVEKLENENLGIEEGLNLYDEAIKAGKKCIDQLNEGKGKLELLNKDLSRLSLNDEEQV